MASAEPPPPLGLSGTREQFCLLGGRGINLAGAGSLDNRGLIAGPLGPPSMVTCGSGTRRGQPSSIDAPHDTSVTRSASTAASASRKCSAGSRPPPASQRSSSEDAPGSTASLHSDADRLQPDPAAQAPDRLLMSIPENRKLARRRNYRSHLRSVPTLSQPRRRLAAIAGGRREPACSGGGRFHAR